MAPYLSIIIPTLNEEQYLPRLLDDLSLQKSTNFEVIVIDASPNEKTKNVLYSNECPFPHSYYKIDRQNVAYQKNEGAKYAQGEYIVFLDADSRIEPKFTFQIAKATQNNRGLVYRPYTVPDDKEYLEMETLFFIWNIVVELSFLTSTPLGDGGCLIFDKNFFTRIHGFNEKVHAEDYEIMRRCVEWGVRPRFISDANVIVSLRRIKREYKLKLLYKHTYVTFSSLFKLEVKTGTIKYDMGGGVTQEAHLSKNKLEALKKFLSKDYFKSLQTLIRKMGENT